MFFVQIIHLHKLINLLKLEAIVMLSGMERAVTIVDHLLGPMWLCCHLSRCNSTT